MARAREGATTCLAVAAIALAVAAVPAHAGANPAPEAQIKAGIVYNLALSVVWPDTVLNPGSFVIGVVGHDDNDPLLAHLAGKEVRRRTLSLVDPLGPSAIGRAQIAYISHSEQPRLRELLVSLAGRPILTVSDIDGFCEAGGMVQLRRDRNRIQLRVNRAAAEAAGLKLSSQLLKVAEIVKGGD